MGKDEHLRDGQVDTEHLCVINGVTLMFFYIIVLNQLLELMVSRQTLLHPSQLVYNQC